MQSWGLHRAGITAPSHDFGKRSRPVRRFLFLDRENGALSTISAYCRCTWKAIFSGGKLL